MITSRTKCAAVIGGGPAGLMAAEMLIMSGVPVTLHDAKPTVGRKLLMAGKSGLNLTYDEDIERFLDRFGDRRDVLEAHLRAFGPEEVKTWAKNLGSEIFTGSTKRVFPKEMKASPLLRAWLGRLGDMGLKIHTRHFWRGWADDGALVFDTAGGPVTQRADATVLALGGASWPRLGSDGAWTGILAARDVGFTPLAPANCGFDCAWSDHFRSRFAGTPVKSCALAVAGTSIPGDFVITGHGVEGGAVYTHSAALRQQIKSRGAATLLVDLAPNRSEEKLAASLSRDRGKQSLSNYLRKAAGLDGAKANLLREKLPPTTFERPEKLASAIKSLGLTLTAPRPIAEAISSAGGVAFDGLNDSMMLRAMPGVFVAGEMLDWEAPTGGYLMTACLATGRAAGLGAVAWLRGSVESADQPSNPIERG